MRLGGAHRRGGEQGGVDLRGIPGRAELLADLEMRRDPIYGVRRSAAAGVRCRAADAAISRDAAVTPSLAAVLGEFCVQIEAVARELLQWRAVAPMAREKAAGLARRGAGEPTALDDNRLHAAAAEKIGDRGADDAAAGDDDSHHRACAIIVAR